MGKKCDHPKKELIPLERSPSAISGKIVSLEEVYYCKKCKQTIIKVRKRFEDE